jgi:hypothetical protein
MKRLFSPLMILAGLLFAGSAAHAQYAVIYSDVAYDSQANALVIDGNTEVDPVADMYYEAQSNGYLFEWDYAVSSWEEVWTGGSTFFNGSPYDDAYYQYQIPLSDLPNYGSPLSFMLQTNSFITADFTCSGGGYNDYYGFSLITPGNYSGYATVYPAGSSACTGSNSYYIGATYAGYTF